MTRVFKHLIARAALCLSAGALGTAALPALAINLTFYYPVAVGGPITTIIDGMAADFEKDNPGIKIRPVYSGSYRETLAKVLVALKDGKGPDVSVMQSTDVHSLIDEGVIVPFDELLTTDADKQWLAGFFLSFLANSQTKGKTWSIPFQRSTIVMYWNKALFKEAGLDPERPPQNWQELVDMGTKLTRRDAASNVMTWGVQIPSSGYPYWLFQGLTTPNGVSLMNTFGNQTFFDRSDVVNALQYWVDLSSKYKIHPPGIVE